MRKYHKNALARFRSLEHRTRETGHTPFVRIKERHPHWGPEKIRVIYQRAMPERACPSLSSFKRVLDKAGLVEKRKKRRAAEAGRIASGRKAENPNEVWTVDFKGWWRDPEGKKCEPLTVRDEYSRYLLCLERPATPPSSARDSK